MSIPIEINKRLTRAYTKWVGTPYVSGQSVPGPQGGVDCVRICDLVLQEALGLTLEPLPRHAQDAAFHDPKITAEMQRLLFRRFNLRNVEEEERPRALDIIVCSQIMGSGPASNDGHHLILCVSGNQCIDAWPGLGVRKLGMGAVLMGFNIHRIWRPTL